MPEEESADSPLVFVAVIFALTESPPARVNGDANRTEYGIVQVLLDKISEADSSQFVVATDHVELEVYT